MPEPTTLLITGSSRGIGKEMAAHYTNAGSRVIGCSRGPASIVNPLYEHFQLDVGAEEEVAELFRELRQREEPLYAVLNNAGIASMNHAILTPASSVQKVLSTNLMGTFLFCREAAKLMRNRGGRIVNFTSIAVPLNLPGEAIYSASKSAVESLTRILAREFAPFSITVNALGPNPIPTDLISGVPESKMESLLERQAIPRYGTVDDVVNVVDFFRNPGSNMIASQILYLGGV